MQVEANYLIILLSTKGEKHKIYYFREIINKNRVKEKQACKFFQQILSGVEYLHKVNVAHRLKQIEKNFNFFLNKET